MFCICLPCGMVRTMHGHVNGRDRMLETSSVVGPLWHRTKCKILQRCFVHVQLRKGGRWRPLDIFLERFFYAVLLSLHGTARQGCLRHDARDGGDRNEPREVSPQRLGPWPYVSSRGGQGADGGRPNRGHEERGEKQEERFLLLWVDTTLTCLSGPDGWKSLLFWHRPDGVEDGWWAGRSVNPFWTRFQPLYWNLYGNEN